MATPEEVRDLLIARLQSMGLVADQATTTAPGMVQLAGDLGGTATSPTVPGLSGKASTSHTHTAAQISDATTLGRTILGRTLGSSVRSDIGAEEADNPYTALVWHDALAFNRISTPVFEQSTDGTTWTSASTSNGNKMFSQKENQSVQLVDGTTTPYWRVTWSSGVAWSNIDRILFGFSYIGGTVVRNITVESSTDGSAWTSRYSATGNTTNANPFDADITAFGGDGYLRITIQQTSGVALRMNSIKGLTRRMGDQGLGRETSFPYVWDEDRKLGLGTNNLPTTGLVRVGDDTTTNTGGLQFGTDTYLHRDSTNTLRSPGVIIGTQVRASSATPAVASDLTRKDYVDAADAARVPVGTGNTRAYVRDSGGAETTVAYSSSATAQSMVFRTTGGVTSVGEPTASTHAATKNYVDTTAELVANKGAANGYAPLDASSKVPSANLPSYVDDVLEYANTGAFPGTGATGLIYVATGTGKCYRWTGSVYVEISPSDVNSVAGRTGIVTLTSSDMTDSTTVGRAVVAATDAAAARTAIGAGTSSLALGTTGSTACAGNDSRLSDTRTPATGTQFYDPTINGFAATTVRATGAGDFPMGIKLQRACTFTSVTFRANTADASGNLVVELRKNGTTVSGTSTTIAAANQVAGGTSTGSWAFAAGDILTVYITAVGTTPGTGLVADLKGTA
ncbi:hypothetical protein [Rhodococcus opacus]|uniref:Uncharacterized protein n=1 Tax=Rhodococcus opacus TaxID=37919 RepID=A0A2S8JB46_RHOOP|nr:hypothetical protein [Rhodococcus opacus]PQP24179.1 hypothetical protein C5613_14965 [Rhodococcus opacus]